MTATPFRSLGACMTKAVIESRSAAIPKSTRFANQVTSGITKPPPRPERFNDATLVLLPSIAFTLSENSHSEPALLTVATSEGEGCLVLLGDCPAEYAAQKTPAAAPNAYQCMPQLFHDLELSILQSVQATEKDAL